MDSMEAAPATLSTTSPTPVPRPIEATQLVRCRLGARTSSTATRMRNRDPGLAEDGMSFQPIRVSPWSSVS
jgi:hypothetical protein